MQGQTSYRWTKKSPSMQICRIITGLWVIAFLAIVGCGRSQPKAVTEKNVPAPKESPVDGVDPKESLNRDLKQRVPPRSSEVVNAEPEAASDESEANQAQTLADATGIIDDPTAETNELDEEHELVEDDSKLIDPVPLPAPEDATRLSPTEEVWIKRDENKVFIGGQVALRRGMLEMFACPKGTKEHESVVAVNSKASTVHAALLAVGAIPGTPVSYDTEYHPPTGTEIGITVEWKDPDGNWHSADAREWVRNVRTEKQLDVPWVFAGSGFYVDEETKKQHYLAESGDLICVSNFSSAMLDLPVESSQAEAGLLFEAFTDRVPALGTPVRLTLTPKLERADKEAHAGDEKK